MDVGGQHHASDRETWYPLDWRMGWPQSMSGHGDRKKSPCRESNLVIQRLASQFNHWIIPFHQDSLMVSLFRLHFNKYNLNILLYIEKFNLSKGG
jgi:hypothetical protein